MLDQPLLGKRHRYRRSKNRSSFLDWYGRSEQSARAILVSCPLRGEIFRRSPFGSYGILIETGSPCDNPEFLAEKRCNLECHLTGCAAFPKYQGYRLVF